MKKLLLTLLLVVSGMPFISLQAQPNYDFSQMQREKLGRGLIAIRVNQTRSFLSWRYLSSDPQDISFNIYSGDKLMWSTRKNSALVKDYFYLKDTPYTLVPVIDGEERRDMSQDAVVKANSPNGYIEIPMDLPADSTNKSGAYSYSPNDASVGDVDGDGEYEIFLKWDPSNSKDNSNSGYTGDVYIDCYKLDGTKLWRINLGRNIRAGAHYTQFMVYDFDGDGKAEMICKTADATVDGVGTVIGNASADYRNSKGYVLSGPEYLTIFNGETGAAMQTVDYYPQRGTVSSWGDSYGNRLDRYLACVAYLDGKRPSAVMCRGYYTRAVLAAWDWDGKELTRKWVFDSNTSGNSGYRGQGNHNLRVGDVDGDGCDEIVYGSCAIDHNGKGLYTTGMGHGDAMHMTVFDPSSDKLAVWACHENKSDGSSFRDAATGKVLFQIESSDDVGRCMAADIDPTRPGVEMWSSRSGGIRDINGYIVNSSTNGVSMNMAAWWDGTLLRNLQDGTSITRYKYPAGGSTTLLSASGCASNNSTKSNPCLVADMYGDWREELLLRTSDNKALRLYFSTDTTEYCFHSFLEDPVYRSSVAYQNVAYNQPTHVGFYFGADLGKMATATPGNRTFTLDAGTRYDAYEWVLGDETISTERTFTMQVDESKVGTKDTVTFKATFRGYLFIEQVELDYALTSSVENISSGKLSIGATGSGLNVEVADVNEGATVSVYTMNGQLIASHLLPAGDTSLTIPTRSWSAGIYLVRVVNGNATLSQKVVIGD